MTKSGKNIGSTRSAGFEFALKGIIMQKKDFDWSAYMNFSHNRSYWVERNPEVSLADWVDPKGVMSPLYGWQTNGIFHSLDEVRAYKSNGKVLQPEAFPGNKKYVDQNGDGVLDDKDIIYFGNSEPMLNFGLGTSLRWKNITLDIDTYGRINQKRYDNWIFRDLCSGRTNTSVKAYEVWTSFNPNGTWTGIATDITRNNNKSGADDFHLRSRRLPPEERKLLAIQEHQSHIRSATQLAARQPARTECAGVCRFAEHASPQQLRRS